MRGDGTFPFENANSPRNRPCRPTPDAHENTRYNPQASTRSRVSIGSSYRPNVLCKEDVMTATHLTGSAPYDAHVDVSPRSQRSDGPAWNSAQRVGFRFAFCYFVLYGFESLFSALPFVSVVTRWYDALIRTTAIWSGTHILRLTAAQLPVIPTGSGDGMVAWMENLLYIVVAVVACAVWTITDRKRTEYRKLNEWLNIYVRFTLAFVLFGYGFAKIIPNQFPYPTLEKLSEPLGEFSPMGLLWTFMGYSPAYNFFTGMGEALGGLLVCFRRTTTAGALLSIAVLSNVVFLNFTYDVPVKLYSANLLLMAVFLTIPDMRRLLNVLLLNRPTEARNLQPLYRTRAMERTSFTLRALLVAFTAGTQLSGNVSRFHGSTNAPLPSLYGIYDVQSLTRGGKDVPLVVTDSSLWRRVIFSRFDRLSVRTMADSMTRYTVKVDTVARLLVATSRFDSTTKLAFTYTKPAAGELVLAGRVGGDTIVARLKRVDESKFLLNARGFNWVQELPFNR
jgi:hypothetical protein